MTQIERKAREYAKQNGGYVPEDGSGYFIRTDAYEAGYRVGLFEAAKELEQHIDGSDARDDEVNRILSVAIEQLRALATSEELEGGKG